MDIEKKRKEKPILELLNFAIVNVDKPSGPTSFNVSQFVGKTLGIKKTSHFGTLDPMVSGVLPVALGRACRLNEYFMHRDKEYIGIMRVHSEISEDKLKEEMNKFLGKIKQLPPLKSNVKRQEREREIKKFEIIEKDERDVVFIAEVQAGTYIRKLISDLGEKIDGAHMLELRRIRAGVFSEIGSVNLYELEKAFEEYKKGNETALRKILVPGEAVCELLPCLEIKKQVVKKVLSGSPIFDVFCKKDVSLKENEKLCVVCKDELIGCYRATGKKNPAAIPEFVLS